MLDCARLRLRWWVTWWSWASSSETVELVECVSTELFRPRCGRVRTSSASRGTVAVRSGPLVCAVGGLLGREYSSSEERGDSSSILSASFSSKSGGSPFWPMILISTTPIVELPDVWYANNVCFYDSVIDDMQGGEICNVPERCLAKANAPTVEEVKEDTRRNERESDLLQRISTADSSPARGTKETASTYREAREWPRAASLQYGQS